MGSKEESLCILSRSSSATHLLGFPSSGEYFAWKKNISVDHSYKKFSNYFPLKTDSDSRIVNKKDQQDV